jgi:hypothetical protein
MKALEICAHGVARRQRSREQLNLEQRQRAPQEIFPHDINFHYVFFAVACFVFDVAMAGNRRSRKIVLLDSVICDELV